MSENNVRHQMYKQMMLGYRLGPDGSGLFEHAVKCWLDTNPDNPFPEDSEAFECFFRMQRYYMVWKLDGVDKKINMRRMLKAAKELCALKVKNPYKFDKQAAQEEKEALKESAAKSHEEYMKAVQEDQRIKEERQEEVRQIAEELAKIDDENNDRVDNIKAAVDETEANFNAQPEKKHYVFNVVEQEPATELPYFKPEDTPEQASKKKKSWLQRLMKK